MGAEWVGRVKGTRKFSENLSSQLGQKVGEQVMMAPWESAGVTASCQGWYLTGRKNSPAHIARQYLEPSTLTRKRASVDQVQPIFSLKER